MSDIVKGVGSVGIKGTQVAAVADAVVTDVSMFVVSVTDDSVVAPVLSLVRVDEIARSSDPQLANTINTARSPAARPDGRTLSQGPTSPLMVVDTHA